MTDRLALAGGKVDIHHIFPKSGCDKQKFKATVDACIIDRTPLSYRTNRIIGEVGPSDYLAKLESGDKSSPPISKDKLAAFSDQPPDRSDPAAIG